MKNTLLSKWLIAIGALTLTQSCNCERKDSDSSPSSHEQPAYQDSDDDEDYDTDQDDVCSTREKEQPNMEKSSPSVVKEQSETQTAPVVNQSRPSSLPPATPKMNSSGPSGEKVSGTKETSAL